MPMRDFPDPGKAMKSCDLPGREKHMSDQRLTEELVREKTREVFERYRRIARMWQRGILSTEAAVEEMLPGFYGIFPKLLSDCGLVLRIKEDSYRQFAREYEAYRGGRFSEEFPEKFPEEEDPWLRERGKEGRPASAEEKRLFFRLMERFHVEPEYYKPVAQNVPVPDLVPIHQYQTAGVYGIHFRCVDDGGLLADSSPEGKTFALKNELGLTARLTIREDRRGKNRSGLDFDELVMETEQGSLVLLAEFLAEGEIEGYTAPVREGHREVLIRLGERGTKVRWLAFWQDPADAEAFGRYGLWQESRVYARRREEIRDRILKRLLSEAAGQTGD